MRLVKSLRITPPSDAKLITRKQAASSLNIALRSLDHLISAKEIPICRIGKSIRIRPAAIEDFISAREG